MKVSIIGANSFLARNFIAYLKDYKHKLFLYDINEIHYDGCENYYQVDLSNKASIRSINFDCDLMYIFTGKTGTLEGFNDYEDFIQVNEIYFLNILSVYCEKKSKAKVIYPSTRLVYQENKDKRIKENSEIKLRSIYSITKFACENYLKIYNEMFGLKYCIFRICTPYGSLLDNCASYGTYEIFMDQVQNNKKITIFGDGEIRKTFTTIHDICKVLLNGGINKQCLNDIFNIGGDNKSLKEIAEIIGSKHNVPIEHIPWSDLNKKIDAGNTVLDSKKLDDILKIEYCKINWSKN